MGQWILLFHMILKLQRTAIKMWPRAEITVPTVKVMMGDPAVAKEWSESGKNVPYWFRNTECHKHSRGRWGRGVYSTGEAPQRITLILAVHNNKNFTSGGAEFTHTINTARNQNHQVTIQPYVMNKNTTLDEIRKRTNSGNICYYQLENCYPYHIQNDQDHDIQNNNFAWSFVCLRNAAFDFQGSARKYSAQGHLWM